MIHMWTMGFESMHSFFKHIAHYSQNFINITHTLSEKCQLLQAYLSDGNIFPSQLQIKNCTEFHMEFYSNQIQDAITVALSEIRNAVVSNSILFCGTEYNKGLFVLCAYDSNKVLTVGKIQLCLVS